MTIAESSRVAGSRLAQSEWNLSSDLAALKVRRARAISRHPKVCARWSRRIRTGPANWSRTPGALLQRSTVDTEKATYLASQVAKEVHHFPCRRHQSALTCCWRSFQNNGGGARWPGELGNRNGRQASYCIYALDVGSNRVTTDVLTVSDGTHTANLHFAGNYTAQNFKFVSDGGSGTTVYDPPAPSGVSTLDGHGFMLDGDLHEAVTAQAPAVKALLGGFTGGGAEGGTGERARAGRFRYPGQVIADTA